MPFAPRNGVNSTWSTRIDLRIDQEIPLFVDDLKARGFIKFYNIGNMLDSSSGRQYDAPFASLRTVEGNYDAANDTGEHEQRVTGSNGWAGKGLSR